MFPVEDMWEPGEAIEEVKKDCLNLPTPSKGIAEEDVPRKRNH